MKTVIFDLDGTLADITHRLHLVTNGNRRWNEFFAMCINDIPIESIVGLYDMVGTYSPKIGIIIVSGRSDEVRKETEAWLEASEIYYEKLIMRPAGDYTPDHILKEQILDRLLAEGHEILFTVDDRQRVVDMWRRRGITCLQVAAWEENKKKVVGHQILSKNKGLLTLMIGPSGAGKSTWLKGHKAQEMGIHHSHVISSDQIRHDLCGNFRDQTHNDEVFKALKAVVKTRIDNGLPAVVDATNIKRADRIAIVELADGGSVRYIIIDRPLGIKQQDAGWRAEVGFDLIGKHDQTFKSQLKEILKGDELINVEVFDMRKI